MLEIPYQLGKNAKLALVQKITTLQAVFGSQIEITTKENK